MYASRFSSEVNGSQKWFGVNRKEKRQAIKCRIFNWINIHILNLNVRNGQQFGGMNGSGVWLYKCHIRSLNNGTGIYIVRILLKKKMRETTRRLLYRELNKINSEETCANQNWKFDGKPHLYKQPSRSKMEGHILGNNHFQKTLDFQ